MPRRAEKGVFKRPGTDYYHVRYTTPAGVEIRRSARTKDAAEAWAFLERLKQGGGLSFTEAVEKFFERHPLRPTTRAAYRSSLRQWHPLVGHLLLDHIGERHIRRFLAQRLHTVQPQSAQAGLRFLSSLFEFARHQLQIPVTNPVRALGAGVKLARSPERVRWLTDDEVARVLACARAPLHRGIVLTAMETGMRKSEICNLRVRDVDLKGRRILVREGASKSGRGRVIPISDLLFRTLAAHLACAHPDSFVFIHPRSGAPPSNFLWWHRIAVEAGLNDFHFHDLRHHFASRYVQRGGRLQTLAMILGHTTVGMTSRYAHMAIGDMEREFRALEGK